jgi:hypothetical protein
MQGRRRLSDGDHITVGRTTLTFCDPQEEDADVTLVEGALAPIRTYSEQQLRILRAFCAPLLGDGEGVTPATDAATAQAVGVSSAVAGRELDAVARSFGYLDLPVEERRVRTALTAVRSGLVSDADR